MNDILNPYIAGAPVVETSMFFGREDVFSWIERSLAGKYVDHILVLHGQRRVGKTSVLKQIPNFLPEKYIQVFFDLQGRTGTTLDRFLWWLASEIVRTLKKERGITLPKPDRKTFKDTEYLINEFLPSLQPILGEHVLLLTFDEFDTLDQADIQDELAKPLIAYLRRLIEMDGLSFIFSIGSSGDKLENMQASYTDFFKSALYRKISFLTRDDCHRLITKPVEGVIKYNRKAVDQIVRISSGHPYFAQLTCHELFSRCQKTGSREISEKDVEAVLEDVIERGTVNLKFVWDEASDLEKWILAALAQLDGGSNQKLAKVLNTQRVRFSDSDLNSAIIHLQDKDVITQDNRFVIHLMRMWLVANRPMDRVREELVEVNPIANRYIEIGDEYRDRGQNQPAIDSYQQALSADPENLKAQSSIATVYLEQEDYPEAVAAFELALKIDDEDVVARTGYCDAQLALGDAAQSRAETDEAIGLFQAILVINAAHADARQRLAAIYQEQAEDFLVAGQDDKALSAFNQAMMFTPEDDRLSARYEEVLAEKKSRVINTWLGKAEKALSRQRWDDAAEMVAEAVKIDPDNQELQIKLVEAKDAPRQFQLQGYRREAEQAVARGNWDKAIAAIETALQLAPEDQSLADLLETVRNDRLNERLDLCAQQVEKAVAAGNWDAAIQAIQNAINLAPKDKKWQTQLDEIERDRHQARLDVLHAQAAEARENSRWDEAVSALQELLKLEDSEDVRAEIESIRKEKRARELAVFRSQAEKAVAAGNWDAAIQAVQHAIELAPKEKQWQTQLDEIERARHQARLDVLHAQAGEARQNGRWDEAVSALQELLKLEDSADVRAEIKSIRKEKRAHELAAFRSQAEKATKVENWDEAVQAWDAYLALKPDDADSITSELQHARKYARIAGNYTEAQQAIRKKRYGRAIELLQGIIAQDPTYKYTSRLLVEAVEANKATPVWRRPWVLPAAGAVTLIVLGIFFGPSLFNSLTAEQTSTLVPESTSAPVLTPTPAVTQVFYEPILAYIESEAPSFEDEFLTADRAWGRSSDWQDIFVLVHDGSLTIKDNAEAGTSIPINGLLNASNFALQFDCNLTPDDQQLDEMGVMFRAAEDQSEYYSYKFINKGDSWGWTLVQLNENDNLLSLASGDIDLSPDPTFNRFLIIVHENDLSFFMNGVLIHETENIVLSGETNFFFGSGAYETRALIDNVEFWNLSGEETGASEEALAETNFSATAAVVLAYVTEQTPTFEDDFSTSRSEWGFPSEGYAIDDIREGRVLKISEAIQESNELLLDNGLPGFSFPTNGLFDAANFWLEFDCNLISVDQQLDEMGVVFRAAQDQSEYYSFKFVNQGDSWGWALVQWNENDNLVSLASGDIHISSDSGFIIVVLDNNLLIFMNDALIYSTESITLSGDSNLFFGAGSDAAYALLDNVKFWNLEGVDLGAAISTPAPTSTSVPDWVTDFAAPILAAIADREPDFQDDFSSSTNGWVGYDEIKDGVMRLKQGGSITNPYFSDIQNYVLKIDFSSTTATNYIKIDDTHSIYITPGTYGLCWYSWGSCTYNSRFAKAENQIVVIVSDNQASFYLDGIPVENNNAYFNQGQFEFACDISCEFDNVEFWNLEGVDLGAAISTPTPYSTALPDWVTDLAEPILAAIEDREPDFQDDFSGNTNGWVGYDEIKYGVMRLGGSDHITNPYFSGIQNYVLEVDLFSTACCNHVFIDETHSFYVSPSHWGTCWYDWEDCSSDRIPAYNPNHIVVIVSDNQAGFYLNGTPVANHNIGFSYDQLEFNCSEYCEFDNVKFWNLDLVDINP